MQRWREVLRAQLGQMQMPTRAAILLALVALLHGSLIHAAATRELWLFALMTVVNIVAIGAYAWFGPDEW